MACVDVEELSEGANVVIDVAAAVVVVEVEGDEGADEDDDDDDGVKGIPDEPGFE